METTTKTLEEIVKELADDVRPYVQRIESRLATTRGHYGDYMAMLGAMPRPEGRKLLSMALVEAGADPQGVRDAMHVLGHTS